MHPIAGVVNQVIEVVDVDGVVRRIDVDDVVQRIDIDKVVQRIDMNKMLFRIDWNSQLDRVNFDAILKRIDTSAIVARSSTGVFTNFLDMLRLQVTMIDLYLRIITRCRIWSEQHRQRCYLPPAPGRHRQRDDCHPYPRGRMNKAVAVQGRYCGFVSKAIAIFIDIFAITLLFALMFRLIDWCLILFLGISQAEAENKTKGFQNQSNAWMVVIYCVHWFTYFFLSIGLAGQTIGKAIVGLKVCDCNRSSPYAPVTIKQAFVRTCLLPITLTLCPPLGLIGLFRRDGRMLHDLVANTGIIYLWDAKLAKMRNRAQRQGQGSAYSDDDAPDELDELLENDDDHSNDNTAGSYQGQEIFLRRDGYQNGGSSMENPSSDSYYSANPTGNSRHHEIRTGCCNIL